MCIEDWGIEPPERRTSKLSYRARVGVPGFSFLEFFGYRGVVSKEVGINCPFQGVAKERFLEAIRVVF